MDLWTQQLSKLGYHLDDSNHCIYQDQQAIVDLPKIFIAPLPHLGLLTIDGPDTGKFLQGQTTCNLNSVNLQNGSPGAYCTPKGRMVSNFYIAQTDAQLFKLRMRRDLLQKTMEVFKKYIVFSKAAQKIDEEYLLLGLHGPSARELVTRVWGSTPQGQHQQVITNGHVAIQLDSHGLCFELWVQHAQFASIWPQLSADAQCCGSRTWELLMIREGLADVCAATTEEFIPQMLNYQLTGAVSFSKGCYTGQEVVARMQYRGKLKRRLYHIGWPGDTTPEPGAPLYAHGQSQSIGNIVNVVALENGRIEALAVITRSNVAAQDVFIDQKNTPVEILGLPYAIDDEPEGDETPN